MFCSNMQETVLRDLTFSSFPEGLFILLFFQYLSNLPYCQSQVLSLEDTLVSSTLEKKRLKNMKLMLLSSIPSIKPRVSNQTISMHCVDLSSLSYAIYPQVIQGFWSSSEQNLASQCTSRKHQKSSPCPLQFRLCLCLLGKSMILTTLMLKDGDVLHIFQQARSQPAADACVIQVQRLEKETGQKAQSFYWSKQESHKLPH